MKNWLQNLLKILVDINKEVSDQKKMIIAGGAGASGTE